MRERPRRRPAKRGFACVDCDAPVETARPKRRRGQSRVQIYDSTPIHVMRCPPCEKIYRSSPPSISDETGKDEAEEKAAVPA